jgi:hypothetical protein
MGCCPSHYRVIVVTGNVISFNYPVQNVQYPELIEEFRDALSKNSEAVFRLSINVRWSRPVAMVPLLQELLDESSERRARIKSVEIRPMFSSDPLRLKPHLADFEQTKILLNTYGSKVPKSATFVHKINQSLRLE